jgi:hypothetical protein
MEAGPAMDPLEPFAITEQALRDSYVFVSRFEALREQFGYREMHDQALREIASATGVDYEVLRLARHVRNALAHADPVNR